MPARPVNQAARVLNARVKSSFVLTVDFARRVNEVVSGLDLKTLVNDLYMSSHTYSDKRAGDA